jgi:hypothetical protein
MSQRVMGEEIIKRRIAELPNPRPRHIDADLLDELARGLAHTARFVRPTNFPRNARAASDMALRMK